MDSGSKLPWKEERLINELTQGMENAKLLHFHLSSTSGPEGQELLLHRILSSYEKALSIVKRKGSLARKGQGSAVASGGPESPISADGSPRSDDLNNNSRDHQGFTATKKRKLQPTWTEQVRINSESGLDGTSDDGFSWRKYGQKDILGAKYPRSYYRCTHRHTQNCWASKQVQRSDNDPNVFDITYKGTHSCNQSTHPVPLPASPNQTQPTSKNNPQQQNRVLLSLKANLRVTTNDLDNNSNEKYEVQPQFCFPSTYEESYNLPMVSLNGEDHWCPQFLSPATSGTSYFSPVASYHMQGFGGSYSYRNQELAMESEIAEILSAHASTSNSPIGGMELQTDPFGLDSNFPFNYSGYFT